MEYKRYINNLNDINTTTFTSFLPIQLDATCNAYQHLALLTNDEKLALNTIEFLVIDTITQ
jgi:DNA-directed RNA polymerase